LAATAAVQAQDKDLSDRTVALLMEYAWQITPNRYVTPEGKVIEVDKSKRARVAIPAESARDIIRVARRSAHAQICGLEEEQLANFRTLMRREQAKATWTDQQMLYINQLHLFTVMTLTGKVKAEAGDRNLPKLKGELQPTTPCSESERSKVRQQIMAYVNADPPRPPLGKQP
jgi:hypothetical protein